MAKKEVKSFCSPLKVTANAAMPLFLLVLFFSESTPMLEEAFFEVEEEREQEHAIKEAGSKEREWKRYHACNNNNAAVVGGCVPQMKVAVLRFATDGIGEDLLFTIEITNTDSELFFEGGYLHAKEEGMEGDPYIGTPAPFKMPRVAPLSTATVSVKLHCMYNKHHTYQKWKKESSVLFSSRVRLAGSCA